MGERLLVSENARSSMQVCHIILSYKSQSPMRLFSQALYGVPCTHHAYKVWHLKAVFWARYTIIMLHTVLLFAGVEKTVMTLKRHYFSSNKHDAPGEIIWSEARQEAPWQGVWYHPSCVRQKRSYTKRDEDYWAGGGIQEVRKHARGDDTTSRSS